MSGLTPKQSQIIEFIRDYIVRNNYSPSYREIMAYFGFSSLGSVHKHLSILKRKGLIKMEKNCSRSISLISQPNQAVDSISYIDIPFLGYLVEGEPLQTLSQTNPIPVPHAFVSSSDTCYALKAKDHSLAKSYIRKGDLLIVEAASQAKNGQTVLILLNEKETYIKQIHDQGAYIKLEGGCQEPPMIVTPKDFLIQGILKGLIRDYS